MDVIETFISGMMTAAGCLVVCILLFVAGILAIAFWPVTLIATALAFLLLFGYLAEKRRKALAGTTAPTDRKE